MAIPQVINAIGSFLSSTASRIVSTLTAKKITDGLSKNKSLSQNKNARSSQGDQLHKIEIKYLRDKIKREQQLIAIQEELAKIRGFEVASGIKSAMNRAEREKIALEISEKDLQLKRQALELAQERFKHQQQVDNVKNFQAQQLLELQAKELEILEKEREDRRNVSHLYLQLVQNKNSQEIDLKIKKIQAEWDLENWTGVLSRDEMQQILEEGREKHRLLMLVSPPDIESCPEFNNQLHKKVRSELKKFMEINYPLESELCSVEFYGKFFKSSVFDTEIKQYEKILSPIPTVVVYSDVTDEKVYFHVHGWGFPQPVSLTLPWDWQEEREKLEQSEGNDSLRVMQNSIVDIHKLLASFLADLYYLQINPSHEIRLFQLEGEFPTEWLQDQFEALQDLQKQVQLIYGDNLMNANKKTLFNLSDSLPKQRLAVRMREQSNVIESGSPTIYQIPVEPDTQDQNSLISKCHIGQPISPDPPEKVLMVVGATGAGKTTLINGMVNYILGVQWEDDFRFKLIVDEGRKSQAYSQTQWITAYTLHPIEGCSLPYKLTIIDTPGFGDTSGLKRDKFITKQIHKFFSEQGLHGIDHLEGVGFVTQSALPRLTPTQKYIFDSILSIFGKDIAENIFIMITFADGNKPPVIKAIKEASVPYSKYFKFNNSAIFPNDLADEVEPEEDDEDDQDQDVNEMFWQIGYKSFEKFFVAFEKAESKSLQLTKDVLKERKQLEVIIEGLQPQIKAGLSKLNQLQQEEHILEQHQADINANRNFTYTVKIPKTRKVDTPPGHYVTNCLQCNRTCHANCAYADDNDKYLCSAMDGGGRASAVCTVCPGRCSWTKHVNRPYKFEDYVEEETRTSGDLKKRYDTALSGKNKAQSLIDALKKELQAVCEEVFRMIQRAQQSLHRLDEIALKPDPLTEVQYIDLLIASEKEECKVGWEQRVAYYQEARRCAQILSNMKSATDIEREENIKEWARKLIDKLKYEKAQEIQSRSLNTPRVQDKTNNSGSWFDWMNPFS
ncbi:MAG: 50S ribosome-binding GTPase [Roseofilum sp. SID1]|uniref:GTPase n=1 Tax=Roseofilum sp. SID1 TaxID=2821497 RepID=UPI001B09EBDF|nr:GTPase [Roseofilum sp. SID1]MBP0036594.1 50S ribosome-binding GTPase [Roseofilum sp. SID1]